MSVRLSTVSLAVLASALLVRAETNPVIEWTALFLDAIRTATSAPTLASRNLAIFHTSIYDAVNSITRTHQPYRFALDAPPDASAEAAAVGAAFGVSVLLYPGHRAAFDGAYARYLALHSGRTEIAQSLDLGRWIAYQAVDGRVADGSSAQVPYIPSEEPGQWRRTPPFYRPPTDPHWGLLVPFCIEDLEPFMPSPPPPLTNTAYATDLNQVKGLGGKVSVERTPEQSLIAQFWSDFSYTETPPGHWLDLAIALAQSEGNSLPETARLCALISLAQADTAIVVWRAKYDYNRWRPVTAIARANEDGNPLTEKAESWESFLPTPPFPEHVSGHSAFSMASAVVLRNFYGTDTVRFTVGSDALPGVFRTYQSFVACAEEIGMSRIYGGIHFMSANRDGKACGAGIGQFVSQNLLLSNGELPLVRIEQSDGRSVHLRVHGHWGETAILEASSDLNAWEPISTNQVVVGGQVLVIEHSGNAAHQFYRVLEGLTQIQ